MPELLITSKAAGLGAIKALATAAALAAGAGYAAGQLVPASIAAIIAIVAYAAYEYLPDAR